MAERHRPSIREIADRAGVSPTTVSHALNRVPSSRVADATRERIEKIAREVGYSPNGLARGLRTQRSHMLALISDEIPTTPYAGRLILGAQEAASSRDYVLLIMTTSGDARIEEHEIRALWQHQVDGVLYAVTPHRDVTVPSSLEGKPLVVVNAESTSPDDVSIYPDERRGGFEATRELLNAGHRVIGFVNTAEDLPARRLRLAGYRDALAEWDIPFSPSLVAEGTSSFARDGYDAARRLLSLPRRPTALFCFNDRMAMGAYRAASEIGLAIPDDLSVIGFDNQEIIAEALSPGLTTLALPYYEMGARGVEVLLGMVDGHEGNPTTRMPMSSTLVRRESVRRPASG